MDGDGSESAQHQACMDSMYIGVAKCETALQHLLDNVLNGDNDAESLNLLNTKMQTVQSFRAQSVQQLAALTSSRVAPKYITNNYEAPPAAEAGPRPSPLEVNPVNSPTLRNSHGYLGHVQGLCLPP